MDCRSGERGEGENVEKEERKERAVREECYIFVELYYFEYELKT